MFVVWLAPARARRRGLGADRARPRLAVGALSGLLIVVLRVQPVVVTLAMYFVLQGVDLLLAPNPGVARPGPSLDLRPRGLGRAGSRRALHDRRAAADLVRARFVAVPPPLYAVGTNEPTAFSSGVNVNAVRVASYALGGLFAGIAGLALTGLVQLGRTRPSRPSTRSRRSRRVALGGTSLAGGRGGLIGALFGAFAIYLLQNLLATLQINPAYLQIVYGGMLSSPS